MERKKEVYIHFGLRTNGSNSVEQEEKIHKHLISVEMQEMSVCRHEKIIQIPRSLRSFLAWRFTLPGVQT